MKKNFRTGLGTVAFISIFLLFNFLLSSCKEHIISPINNPNLAIQALEAIQAGSTVQVVCTGNISCDTSSIRTGGGQTKLAQPYTITSTIPANAAFLIRILGPKGEEIKFKILDLSNK
jgi:hypothetical protein